MANYLQQYRSNNFFNPQRQQQSQGMPSRPYGDLFQPSPPKPMQQPNPYMGLMNQETPALDKYSAHLSNAPNREDNQLSLVGKILAGVAGGSAGLTGGVGAGYSTTKGLLDSRYDRAVDDYERSGKGLGLLADAESMNLDRDSKLSIEMMRQQRAGREEDRKGRLTDAQVKNYTSILETRGQRVIEEAETGNSILVDSNGNEIKVLGKTGSSAAERALAKVASLDDQKSLIDYRAEVEAAKPPKPITPGQQGDARENSALEVFLENPGLFDDGEGNLKEDLDPDHMSIFVNEINRKTRRMGGTTEGRGDISLPMGGQQSSQSLPPSIPINPSSDTSLKINSSDVEGEIDAAIDANAPDATEEQRRDPQYRKQVAEFMGLNY